MIHLLVTQEKNNNETIVSVTYPPSLTVLDRALLGATFTAMFLSALLCGLKQALDSS